MKRGCLLGVILGVLLTCCVLALLAYFLLQDVDLSEEFSKAVETAQAPRIAVPTPHGASSPAYVARDTLGPHRFSPQETAGLSSDQQAVLSDLRWPHAFSILHTEDSEGIPRVVETWHYYDIGMTYVFRDGAFYSTEPEDVWQGNIVPTPYHPNSFVVGSSLEEVAAQAPTARWKAIPGLPSLFEGVALYAARQCVLGFSGEELVYVDAVALMTEGED